MMLELGLDRDYVLDTGSLLWYALLVRLLPFIVVLMSHVVGLFDHPFREQFPDRVLIGQFGRLRSVRH